MVQEFVDRFMAAKPTLREQFEAGHPGSYQDIVEKVVQVIRDEEGYGEPDPKRIHAINDGDYQGTLLYVIAADGYQPSDYWYVKVYYGSCSGCDTLQAINSSWSDDGPSSQQVDEYMTLALHIVQGIKPMQGE